MKRDITISEARNIVRRNAPGDTYSIGLELTSHRGHPDKVEYTIAHHPRRGDNAGDCLLHQADTLREALSKFLAGIRPKRPAELAVVDAQMSDLAAVM